MDTGVFPPPKIALYYKVQGILHFRYLKFLVTQVVYLSQDLNNQPTHYINLMIIAIVFVPPKRTCASCLY